MNIKAESLGRGQLMRIAEEGERIGRLGTVEGKPNWVPGMKRRGEGSEEQRQQK